MKNSEIKVFLVEDNQMYGALLAFHLEQKTEFKLKVFETGESLLDTIKSGDIPHLIVSDYNLDGKVKNALELIEQVKEINAEIPVVILTGHSDLKTAVQVLKEGAFDFIVKDDNAFQRIVSILNHVAELIKLKTEIKVQRARSGRDIKRLVFLFVVTLACTVGFILWN